MKSGVSVRPSGGARRATACSRFLSSSSSRQVSVFVTDAMMAVVIEVVVAIAVSWSWSSPTTSGRTLTDDSNPAFSAGLSAILTHSRPTGYNRNGETVRLLTRAERRQRYSDKQEIEARESAREPARKSPGAQSATPAGGMGGMDLEKGMAGLRGACGLGGRGGSASGLFAKGGTAHGEQDSTASGLGGLGALSQRIAALSTQMSRWAPRRT